MRVTTLILLVGLSTAVQATDKLPMMEFLHDVHQQLISFEQQSGEHPVPAMIKNVHVEMHVITDKDEQGRTAYYVVEGLPEKNDVVTQKISFDLELHTTIDSTRQGKRYRTYSTRTNDNAYRQRGYESGRPYRYPPEHYMPDIYPVILYDKNR
jgi:hypothetical protein